MLTKRTFMLSTLAATSTPLLPALAGQADHPYGDHPLNNPPFTVFLGKYRIELILPFFPELDIDGYPIGLGTIGYAQNGAPMMSKVSFDSANLRQFGDLLIKGGQVNVQIGEHAVSGMINLNDPKLGAIKLTGTKGQTAEFTAGKTKPTKTQNLSAGAMNARIAIAMAAGLAAAQGDTSSNIALLTAKSAQGSSMLKLDLAKG